MVGGSGEWAYRTMWHVDEEEYPLLWHAIERRNLETIRDEGLRHDRDDLHMTLCDPTRYPETNTNYDDNGVASASYAFELDGHCNILVMINHRIAVKHHVRVSQVLSNAVLAPMRAPP